jgi:putative transposase
VVTQHARNLAVGERLNGLRFVIRDRDSKFSDPFDEVFRSAAVRIVKTPIRAPRANAFAERWVRTVRTECLDWMLVFSRRHLERILWIYTAHYNRRRPHGGLELKTPDARPNPPHCFLTRRVRRHHLLGGQIHEYDLAA